jgi:hypothetical protein
METLDTLITLIGILPYIALPVLAVNFFLYITREVRAGKAGAKKVDRRAFPLNSLLFFLAPIIVVFFRSWILKDMARREVGLFLGAKAENRSVWISDRRVLKPDPVIRAIMDLKPAVIRRFHPAQSIPVSITMGPETLRLQLRRDARDPQTYWVYYPALRYTKKHEIGRINTVLLDSYK